jgi:uncharacterized OsmC-like protein
MESLTVMHQGGTRFDIVAGPHTVVTDQPVEDGGTNAGLSPVELFVGSVAACVGYFVGRYCVRHGIPRERLRVEAEWTMAEKPHRVGAVNLSIHLPHPITPEQRERLLKVAHGCTVHQSIAVPGNIDIELV